MSLSETPSKVSAPPAASPDAPFAARASARPGPRRRRRPYRFDALALGLGVGSAILCIGTGLLLRTLLYYRLEFSEDLSLNLALLVGAALSLLAGVLHGRVARKLGFYEHLALLLLVGGGAMLAALIYHLLLLAPGTGFVSGELPRSLGASVGIGLTIGVSFVFFSFLGATVAHLFFAGGAVDPGFRYEWFIARRHLMAKKRSGFLSFITWLSVGGVALAVSFMIVVMSVMSGFEDDLKRKILGTNAHAVVLRYAAAFEDYEAIAKTVRGVDQVTGVSPFILGQVMVSSRKQVDGVLLKGIDPARIGEVTDLRKNIEPGRGSLDLLASPEKLDAYLASHPAAGNPLSPLDAQDPSDPQAPAPDPDADVGEATAAGEDEGEALPVLPGIAIGRELAKSMRVFLGDTLNVISPLSEEMGPMGPVPRSKAFRVAAIFYTGMYEYDSKFGYIDLGEAQGFFDMKDAVTGLELKVTDIDDTRAITHRILTELEGYPYYTKDWGEMNRNLFSALKLEKLVMGFILAAFVGVSSFVILATLIMLVLEKGKDIAILKSMGASDGSIMKVFVLEGLVVGVVGTLGGLVFGLGICALVASGIIGLDPEVYYIDTLPVRIEPMQIFLVCVIAVVLAYLATVYPSVTASRLHPVEGLRDE